MKNNFVIYRKNFCSWDFVVIYLTIPRISILSDGYDEITENKTIETSLNADTTIRFFRSEGFWTFSVIILGFGFVINRQKGY